MLEEILWIAGIILVGAALFALLEWFAKKPPQWVIDTRMWLGRNKQMRVLLIIFFVLIAISAVCLFLAIATSGLHPLPGHIA